MTFLFELSPYVGGRVSAEIPQICGLAKEPSWDHGW